MPFLWKPYTSEKSSEVQSFWKADSIFTRDPTYTVIQWTPLEWAVFIWLLNSIDNACGSISCVRKCPATRGEMGTVWFLCHTVKTSAILISIIGFEEPILASLEPYLYQYRQRFILDSRMPGRDFLHLKMVCCLLLPGSGTAVVLGTVCTIMSCLCLVCRSAQVLHLEEKKSKMEKNFQWLWEGEGGYF